MARQVSDRRLTLTAAVRASVIAQAAELARERGRSQVLGNDGPRPVT